MFGKHKTSGAAITGPVEYIIAGLGNPGREYAAARHNTGFIAMDALSQSVGADVSKIKFKSLCGDAKIAGRRCLLMKPQTFMNASGEAIREATQFYKIPMDHVIVMYDDISLEPGNLRVRPKGSSGGHNGIKSIIYLSGTDVFPRVKIGVGAKPNHEYDLASWVLGKPKKEDAEKIMDAALLADKAIETIINDGIAKAMNDFN